MFGLTEMRAIEEAVSRYAAGFDPDVVEARTAQQIVASAARVENMVATIKALAAARVAATDLWKGKGERSAAHDLARASGSSVTKAKEALETGRRLRSQPALDRAARAGKLSADKAAAISAAAAADPRAEDRLVGVGEGSSLKETRDACDRARAAADSDAEARRARIHRERFCRRRANADGSAEITYRSTPEDIAAFWSVLAGYADAAFHQARAEGRKEPLDAYAADAMQAMAHAAAAAAAAGAAGAAAPAAPDGPGESTGNPGPEDTTAPRSVAPDPTTAPRPGGPTGTSPPDQRPTGTHQEHPTGTTTGMAPHAGARQGTLGLDHDGHPHPVAPPGGPPPAGSPPHTGPPADGPAGAAPPAARTPARTPKPATIIVRIDWDALVRGATAAGDTCDIPGVGPVSVAWVRDLIATGDPFLKAVLTRGRDVVNVVHLGRKPTAHQQTALDWLQPTCQVEGCATDQHLERDHRAPWAQTRITLLGLLDRLCSHHHDLKTHHGWALTPGTGKRPLVPPDDPRHPGHAHPPRDGDPTTGSAA